MCEDITIDTKKKVQKYLKMYIYIRNTYYVYIYIYIYVYKFINIYIT